MIAATAITLTLGLHLGSVHIPDRGQTGVNPGLYLRMEEGLTIGGYRNSWAEPSFYAGWTFEHGPFGLTLGAVSGYRYKPRIRCINYLYGECANSEMAPGRKHILPLAAPSVVLPGLEGLTPRLTLIPGLTKLGSSTIHLSLEKEFK